MSSIKYLLRKYILKILVIKLIQFSVGITNVIIISPAKIINSVSINIKIIKYFIDIKHLNTYKVWLYMFPDARLRILLRL